MRALGMDKFRSVLCPMIRHGVPKEGLGPTPDESQEIQEIIRVRSLPESVDKHEQMVLLNPDDYNSWNYLKEQHAREKDNAMTERQMYLTQQAIQANPKSYAAWHHRYFFFRMDKRNWFFEHKLCKLLLTLDKRNFHCWNYCLKNSFEIGLDLHNYSSMHFKDFRRAFLFIDPSDEGVWRHFEKRHQSSFGVLKTSAAGTEVLFNRPFKGKVSMGGREIEVETFTKRIQLDEVCTHDIFFDGRKANLCVDSDQEVEHVLRLDPDCIHALKYRLMYSNDGSKTVDRLKSLDPLRAIYYDTLVRDRSTIYTINIQ